MADGMCGPSNPLQNFQKHSTVDRTLQQDRLVSRASPSQGFRSSPGPNAGLLDPEFEAFHAGQLPLDHGFQRQQFPAQPGFNQQSQPGPSGGWASDFQRLNISSPPPQFQQQPFTPQHAQQRHDTGGWHQDFARQQGGMGDESMGQMGQMTGQMNSPYRYSPMSGMGMSPQYSGFAGQQAEMSIAQQKQPAEAFDEEAFARAFEAAAQAEMANKEEESKLEFSQEQTQNVEMGQDITMERGKEQEVMINESAERLMATEEGLLDQERIGADTIQDPKTQDLKTWQEENNPDALSRTAGELLNSVRHDQSTKFQNSQFLELMRQFRDKEAVVQGDKIVAAEMSNGADGVESRGISDGLGGGEEAIKETITLLSERLRDIALDQEKPFVKTPENLRHLLHTLISLSLLSPAITFSSVSSTILPTLSQLSAHPTLSTILSIQEIITSIQRLGNFPKSSLAHVVAWKREAKVIRKANEGVVFTIGKADEGIARKWFRDCFANGIDGKAQFHKISQIYSRASQLHDEERSTEGEGEESIESRVSRIRARVEDTVRGITKVKNEGNAMWGVLGYKVKETGNEGLDREIRVVHEQRMRDILGAEVLRVKELCEERGFWEKELSGDEFQVLRNYFGVQGEDAVYGVHWVAIERDVKGRIEEKSRRLQENRLPDPRAAERFRARRKAKEALGSPEEMRDMAEESIGRVKTGED